MGFGDLKTDTGLNVLNDYLSDKSYIDGYQPSQADVAVFDAFSGAPKADFVNALRWYNHITSFSTERSSFPGQKKSIAEYGPVSESSNEAGKDDKKDDDDFDLFGSDDEEEEESEEAKKIREERLAAYAAKKSKKIANKNSKFRNRFLNYLFKDTKPLYIEAQVIAKSSVILDCKPWDDETDMKALEETVRSVAMDGLLWGASKLVPLAYGIRKLQIGCVVEDEKVSIEELTETICEFEDYIQSVDIAAFNKI